MVSGVLSAQHPSGVNISGLGPHATPVAMFYDVEKEKQSTRGCGFAKMKIKTPSFLCVVALECEFSLLLQWQNGGRTLC